MRKRKVAPARPVIVVATPEAMLPERKREINEAWKAWKREKKVSRTRKPRKCIRRIKVAPMPVPVPELPTPSKTPLNTISEEFVVKRELPQLPKVAEKPKKRRRRKQKAPPKPKVEVKSNQWATCLPRPLPSAEGDAERPKVVNVLNLRIGGKNLQYYGDVVMEDLDAEF